MKKEKVSNTQMRVLSININKNHKMFNKIDKWCLDSKNLYNMGMYLIKNYYVGTRKLHSKEEMHDNCKKVIDEVNTWLDNYNNVIVPENIKKKEENPKLNVGTKILKPKDGWGYGKYINKEIISKILLTSEEYKILGSQPSNNVFAQLEEVWKSYFESMKSYSKDKSKFKGIPKMPNYIKGKKGERNIYTLAKEQVKIRDGKLIFLARKDKDMANYSFNVPLKNYERNHSKDCDLREINFIPKNGIYKMDIVYKIEDKPELKEKKNRILGIDIGIDNLATCVNTIGESSFVINGKTLKSDNKYYNKRVAKIKSDLKIINNKHTSKKYLNLTNHRNNRMNTYMHQSSSYILKWCIDNNIDTVVIGNNKGWKQNSDMSKNTNQTFIGIPHQKLIDQLKYKCESKGIEVILVEESYTSGTSFMDNELPIKENYDKSRRIHRGLFKSNAGKLINADVNGAYQIIRKVFPDFIYDENCSLHPKIIIPN